MSADALQQLLDTARAERDAAQMKVQRLQYLVGRSKVRFAYIVLRAPNLGLCVLEAQGGLQDIEAEGE